MSPVPTPTWHMSKYNYAMHHVSLHTNLHIVPDWISITERWYPRDQRDPWSAFQLHVSVCWSHITGLLTSRVPCTLQFKSPLHIASKCASFSKATKWLWHEFCFFDNVISLITYLEKSPSVLRVSIYPLSLLNPSNNINSLRVNSLRFVDAYMRRRVFIGR